MANLRTTTPRAAVPTLTAPNGFAVADADQIKFGDKDVAEALTELMEHSGDVTDAEFQLEVRRRELGDELTSVNVGSESVLVSTLAAQLTSDEQLEIVFTADVTHQGATYLRDDVIHIGPRSNAIENRFNIGGGSDPATAQRVAATEARLNALQKATNAYLGDADPAPFRIYQADNTIGITSVADLDGDYKLVIKDPAAFVTGPLVGNESRIDELRIFITNGGISQRMHSVDPYTYSADPQVIAFNISDAEESSVAASITQDYVQFTVGYYLDNGAVGTSQTYRLPISDLFETETAKVRRLQSRSGVGGGRDFGNDAGEIAAQAEGNSQARWPKDKLPEDVAYGDLDRLAVFGSYDLNPAGIPDRVMPDYIALTLSHKRVNKIVKNIQVNIGGAVVANATRIANPVPPVTDPLVSFNLASNVYEESGGVLNLTWPNPAGKRNVENSLTTAQQFIEGNITYTFEDDTVIGDKIQFAVNNNAFRSTETGGGDDVSGAPTGTAIADADYVVFTDSSDADKVKRRLFSTFIDRVRSGMNVVTSTAKGLMSAAMFNKLDALPTRAELTSEIDDIGDLRARYSTPATPVAQDRFFFTDENQTDDPIRYVVFNNLAAAINAAQGLDTNDLEFRAGTLGLSDRARTLLAALVGTSALLVDSEDDPVEASEDTLDKLLLRGNRLYYTVPVHYADPVVGWRLFATGDLSDSAYTWGGVQQVNPAAPRNTIIYSIPGRNWERRGTFAGSLIWGPYNQPNFIGHFANEAEADRHATATGQSAFYGDNMYIVNAYTPRTPDAYAWVLYESAIRIGPDNLDNADAAKQTALRGAIGAAAVFVGNTLPAGTAVNNGDWVIITADVESGLVWTDFAGTALTSAEAGDLGVYVGGRTWQRLGNMIQGPAKIRTQALTSAVAITWNVAVGHTATLTLGANTTLRISGGGDGDVAFLKAKQDATGGRTLTLHSSVLRFKDVAAPVLSTFANAVDLLMFVNDGGTWNYVGMK